MLLYTLSLSVMILGSWRSIPTWSVMTSFDREPVCWWICSLLKSWVVKVGNITWTWAGRLMNSSVLDVYSETRQTSRVSSNLFRSRMSCVISGMVWLIPFCCYVLGAHAINYWFPLRIMLSISLCRAFPCLSKCCCHFLWVFSYIIFLNWDVCCTSWYLA